MNLKKVLSTNVITMELEATEKEAIIEEMVDFLISAQKIKESDREAVLQAVLKRESQMSTGIQKGIAIPHGKSAAVKELVACVALSKEGRNFNSLDGEASHIFVMTLSPLDKMGPHVQFLAEISRLLTQSSLRTELLSAQTKEAVLKLFLES